MMGYLIVEAYYTNAPNREKAVHDILSVTDYAEFLRRSGYEDRLK
jgi:hypothetical protein